MKYLTSALVLFVLLAGCERRKGTGTLFQARSGFKTHLTKTLREGTPPTQPPAGVFTLVHYDSSAGKLAAYLTPDRGDGKKRPAIIWITGGDSNTIGEVWSEAPHSNDQTASAYREAGIVMMFPSLRGGNDNPGAQEKFLGEVDDVVAAAAFLARQPYVDPQRIYLGGHSSGGTLALLTAEYSQGFRSVFSFGPVGDLSDYGGGIPLPFDVNDRREMDLRAPIMWIDSIKTPTFLFEGAQGNIGPLNQLNKAARKNPFVQTYPVAGATHFSILWPVNRLIAQKIVADTGERTNIAFSQSEVADAFAR